MFEPIDTTKAPKAIGPYSQAVRVGQLVFCSGQIALNPETGLMIEGDASAQTNQVMKNLGAVLEAAGSSLSAVVKTTIFLQNLSDFERVNTVYSQWLKPPYPARATIEVSRLPREALVEIEAVAKVLS